MSSVNSDSFLTAQQTQRTLKSMIDSFVDHNGHTALVAFTEEGSNTLSYSALLDQIRDMAAGLLGNGLKVGEPAIIFASNSPSWVVSCLAVIYSGGVAVPVDPQHSDEVLKHIVEDSKAQWIFTDEQGEGKLHEALPNRKFHLYRIDVDRGASSWKSLLADPKDRLKAKDKPIGADETTIIFYTSGTTGMPKGVPLTHTNILMQLDSVIAKVDLLRPTDRILLPLPFFHVYPLNVGMFGPLRMGLPIIMPLSLTGPELMRAIHEGGATVFVGVPRLLRSIFQAIDKKVHANKIAGSLYDASTGVCGFTDRYLKLPIGKILFKPLRSGFAPTLRLFTSGGAPLDPIISRKIKALGWDLAVGYGLTETAPLLSIRLNSNSALESVGCPIPGVRLRVVEYEDPDSEQKGKKRSKKDSEEQSADYRGEGEIQAHGPNIFQGYLNLPDKTAEAFTEDGWFRTGDLGKLKGGNLYITGRGSSTLVMEGGKKINPEDVEEKLAKQPGIREIALLQHEHKLVALIVPDLKTISLENTVDEIGRALKSAAAGTASYLHITDFAVTRHPLPRTNLGKLKRHELYDLFEQAKAQQSSKKKSGAEVLTSEDKQLLSDPAAEACFHWLKKRFPDHEITLETSPELELNIDSLEWMNLTLELLESTGVQLSEESISRVATVRDLLHEISTSGKKGSKHASSPLEEPERFLDKNQRKYVEPLSSWKLKLAEFFYQLNLLLMSPFKIEVIGLEKLPREQFVFTPNHASYIDAFALAAAIPEERLKNTQWAGWTGIAFGNPIFSFLSRVSQVFPVDAKKSLVTSLALATSVLKQGKNLVWFPEAERTLTGELLPFKQGIGVLLEKVPVKVVPVFLQGTRKALPPGAFFPRQAKIRVIFGEPVDAAMLEKEGDGRTAPERIANALRDRVNALAQENVIEPATDELAKRLEVSQKEPKHAGKNP